MELSPNSDSNAVDVLILGTAEWDSPIATNQHYVARELAHDYDVRFVESLGLRRPRIERRDIIRMSNRLRKSISASSPTAGQKKPDTIHVTSPLVVPFHRAPTRTLNRALLRHSVSEWLNTQRRRVLWTFTPVTYGLDAEADVTVYHCVDLLSRVAGIDRTAVHQGEKRLSSRVTLSIATSQAVADHLTAIGFSEVLLLTNVADTSVFQAASLPVAERRPAALFAGNLSPHKVDTELLKSLAARLQGRGELLLAGPIAAGGGSYQSELDELEALGAKYLGVLSLTELAEVAGHCTVGLIPYALNDYTRGVSPLKCYEYLASGLAVVSTELPEMVRLARTNSHFTTVERHHFIDSVLAVIDPPTDDVRIERATLAESGSWSGRGAFLRHLLFSRLTPSEEKQP